MNLVVDLGNTRVKAAVFKNGEITGFKAFSSVADLQNDTAFYANTKQVIIASVTDGHQKLMTFFKDKRTLLFEAGTPIPIQNLYKSVSTLGSDRLAAAIGAYTLYPGRNVLSIDAGTCIKYNFVNQNNEYIGGAISPGLNMRLMAMNHYTSRLPLVPMDYNYDKLTGTSTAQSILSGALLGAVCEVESAIERYRQAYDNLTVVITGGDGDYLCKQVKSRFFAHPYLVLIGLNTILNYNFEK